MKKLYIVCLTWVLTLTGMAQTIKYPAEVKNLYEAADKETTLSEGAIKPVIGIPVTNNATQEALMVQQNGGAAILITPTLDVNALRNIAATLDGLVLTTGVKAEDAFSVLLNKVAADRNVPVLGDNELMAKIDSGLWRLHNNCKDYKELIAQAKLYKKAKALHMRIFSIDTHADLPGEYKKGMSVGLRKTNQVSVQKMEEGLLDGECIINFLSDGAKTPEQLKKAEEKAKKTMDEIYADVEKYHDYCGIATTPEEAAKLKLEGKKVLFIGLENGAGFGGDLKNIKWFANRGMIYTTLVWMKDNAICSSSSTRYKENTPEKGLTPFGKKVVKELNKQGVMVDLSHASEQSFWDCIKLSKAPIICSHSGCMAKFNNDRNLTDDQIRALAKKGGVVQIYAVWNYQGPDKYKITVKNMVDDLEHAIKIGGIDHVGIGADFDGGGGYTGIMAENDALNITMELLRRGYNSEDIAKIWGGNFMRVMQEVQRR